MTVHLSSAKMGACVRIRSKIFSADVNKDIKADIVKTVLLKKSYAFFLFFFGNVTDFSVDPLFLSSINV